MLKSSELRNLSKQELQEKLTALKKSVFEMRTQGATARIEKPSKVREAKKDIARILTVLREKQG